MIMNVTKNEQELIEMLRLFRRCKHNSRRGLEWAIDGIVENLKDEDESQM